MKTKYSHLIISLFSLLFTMAISSCGENEIIVPDTSEEDIKLDIDSVSSHFKFEYTYNDGVTELTDEQLSYVDLSRGEYFMPSSIYLKSNTPKELIPKKGTIMVAFTGNDVFPFGLMSVVNSVTELNDGILLDVSDATLDEVYKDLDMDIQLNAEQIKKMKYPNCVIAEPILEEIGESDFFEGSPSCQNYNKNINNESNAYTNLCPSNLSSSAKANDESPKKWFERFHVEFKKADNGVKAELALPIKKHSDKNKNITCTFGFNGYISYKPLTIESVVKISKGHVDAQDLGYAINIAWDANIFLECKNNKFGKIPFCECFIPIPIEGTPIAILILNKSEVGVSGKIKLSGGANNNFTLCVPKEASKFLDTNVGANKKASSDFNFLKMLLNRLNTLEVEGSLYVETNFALALGTISKEKPGGGINLKTKPQISGKFNFLDPDNFKNNPDVALDVNMDISIFATWKIEDFDDPTISAIVFNNTTNFGSFPVFPRLDNICGTRKKGSSYAEIMYSTGPMYLLAPLVATNAAKLNMCFASSKWIDDPLDGYIVKTVAPEVAYKEGLDVTYKASIDNLSKNESYIGIPRFETLGGLVKLYGTPIPLLENQEKRLALIGPSYGADFEYEQKSVAMGYDEQGRVKKVINKMLQIESVITRDPIVITQKEYEFDDNTGEKIYYSSDKYSKIVLDEKSGVIKSLYNEDEAQHYKFYYDDQYHLTGIAGGGVSIKLDWDSNGDLTTITNSEDGFTDVIFQYEYSNKINPQGTWTLATGYMLDVFSYGKFIGRAPKHLPKHMVYTTIDCDGTYTESYDLSYETVGTVGVGEIQNEIWKFKRYGQKYEISFPYIYRNVPISDQQLEYDNALGITRSVENDGKVDEEVIGAFSRLRKARLFSH